MIRYYSTFVGLIVIVLMIHSCRPEGEVVREDKDVFSATDHVKIGEALSDYILENPSDFSLYNPKNNKELYQYLNTLLFTCVNTQNVENRNKFPWEILIIKNDEIEDAFTLPGGRIYITSGFLKFLTAEYQLMALIGHEMYYSDQGKTLDILVNNFSGLLLGDLTYGNNVNETRDMVNALIEIPYDDELVEEADKYTINILCPFQYDPSGIETILSSITDEIFPLEWLDTKPSYKDREEEILRTAEACGESSTIDEERYENLILKNLN